MRRILIASLIAAILAVPMLLAPSTASADLGGLDQEEIAAIEAINEIRVALGLAPLKLSPILTEAAEWMAEDMADHDTIDHTDSLNRAWDIRIREGFGYAPNAFIRENLVVGTSLERGEAAVAEWQNSPPHRDNNEASDVTVAGIARVHAPDTRYQWFWVLNLGSHEDSGTVSIAQFQQVPVTGDPPVGTGEGTFAVDFPSTGVNLTSWNGGTLADMAEGARIGGARSIFITVDGRWVSYSIAGPAFVNATFASRFPGGEVPSGTVLLIVK